MPLTSRQGGRIFFPERVNNAVLWDFVGTFASARNQGRSDFTLDFSPSELAYPEAMLPLIAIVDRERKLGVDFQVVPPLHANLARLFYNANWEAHLSGRDGEGMEHDLHMPASRFTSPAEQTARVNGVMDIILRTLSISRPALQALEWSLNEITDNVLNHAETASRGGFVQTSTFREHHTVSFVVADGGRGVLSSMREGFPSLRSDKDALEEAIKTGVTRSSDVGQGNGLAGTLAIASRSGGSFAIASGAAYLTVYRPDEEDNYIQRSQTHSAIQSLAGTMVKVEIRTDREVRLEEVLDFGSGVGARPAWGGWDYYDATLGTERDGLFRIQVASEQSGFGSRQAGRHLRTKLVNLLDADPSSVVEVDWSGVPLISSSFADEAIGRMFVEVGPMTFMARIRLVGMEPLVASLVDRAIIQRTRQD